jgi:hypothetical protein
MRLRIYLLHIATVLLTVWVNVFVNVLATGFGRRPGTGSAR